ncbi:hypothetical protein B0H11DRAFT_2116070 [Mycena galericulata]|nr:hypothetical protein B0H11DRAFT_2116070 [Mycena galericulata]
MSTNTSQSSEIMTSPVFRYAVLVVLAVVVIMGAGVCYRTRVYRRQINQMAMAGGRGPILPTVTTAPDWGPKPRLFDVYLRPPHGSLNEKEKIAEDGSWEDMMPISLTRGAAPSPSIAHISVMISMPSKQPFAPPDPTPDDERNIPYVEFGMAEVAGSQTDVLLRSSSESESGVKPKR